MSDPELEVEILPGVKYRIQSVDYGTFLERSESSIILRPKKDFKKNQQASPPNIVALTFLS